jgi:hypothetical protein
MFMDEQSGQIEGTEMEGEAENIVTVPTDVAASEAPVSGLEKPARKARGSRKTRNAEKNESAPVIAKKAKSAKPAPASWTFPKNSLEDTLIVPRSIEEQNAGNPMRSDVLVKAVGYSTVNDWRFLELLRSANQYGIVEGSGRQAMVALTGIGQDIVAPSTPKARQAALIKAFHNVEQFSKVDKFYSGKKLPEDEFFENTLVRDFHVPRERVRTFIDVFTRNLNFLHSFRPSDIRPPTPDSSFVERQPSLPPAEEQMEGTRTFLDTCFVMMPFGQWLDQYYKDIFIPAIKEAGMEPVRADELFSTGSVIEQIWDQIKRAKVLLADLTGKNANVFYELGLAHAATKPVVFTTANLDDVPFDLRHLRVVTYDIRDPAWGLKLQKSLSTYLRAAKTDPAKSVPQPFRRVAELDKDQI